MIKIALLFFLLLIPLNVKSQKIFYCDSTYMLNSQAFESNCAFFFNFTDNCLDSLMMKVSEKDRFVLKPIKIIAPTNAEKKIDGLVSGSIDGDTIFTIEYKNGLANGLFILYGIRDTVSVTTMRFGKKNGEQFYQSNHNPPIYITQMFADGVPSGPIVEKQGGKTLFVCNFKNGVMHGAQYQFFETGELSWYRINENGKTKDGNYFRFNIEGEIVEEMKFKNGKLKKSIRYSDGKQISVRVFKQ